MTRRLLTLLIAEDGQDLIEYALLAATIAFTTIAAVGVLSSNMADAYTSWDSATQGLWEVPDPQE